MRMPDSFTEEQEHRRTLLAAAAKGDVTAQKELLAQYSVRILSAAERAKLEYAQTEPDKTRARRYT